MKLAIAIKPISASAIHYCEWTQMYFEQLCVALNRKSAIQNGHLNNDTKELLLCGLPMGYSRLKSRFEVDSVQMDDEEDTLVRLIDTLPSEQYIELAINILTPYCHIEFDEATLEKLDKLGYS